jgi:hypothetical protein
MSISMTRTQSVNRSIWDPRAKLCNIGITWGSFLRHLFMVFLWISSVIFSAARSTGELFSSYNALRFQPAAIALAIFLQRNARRRFDVYTILWAVVFGFATLNILTLAARRFDPHRRGLSFGELLAVLIVLLSVFLLGWEMLSVFHIFPLKLQR